MAYYKGTHNTVLLLDNNNNIASMRLSECTMNTVD